MKRQNSTINDILKSECTGCCACFSICPVRCIEMIEDNEGFQYPVIDEKKCVKCLKCKNICPLFFNQRTIYPLHMYAAKNNDEEIRKNSSSGGVFSLFAENTIKKEGIIFGARFNGSWEVVHDCTETIEGLKEFYGSKYVASIIGDTYKKTKEFLENDKDVLFSGTPCQIAGLKSFLQKDYNNLICIDFICHGVPSPLVWREYLKELITLNLSHKIHKINFRDKKTGWKNFSTSFEFYDKEDNIYILSESHFENTYFTGFLCDIYLRPSCYNCPVKPLKSGADITIGDYWGIENILPKYDDNMGVSIILINTNNGLKYFENLSLNYIETTNKDIDKISSLLRNTKRRLPEERNKFFNYWYKKESVKRHIWKYSKNIKLKKNIRRNIVKILNVMKKYMHR